MWGFFTLQTIKIIFQTIKTRRKESFIFFPLKYRTKIKETIDLHEHFCISTVLYMVIAYDWQYMSLYH